MSYVIFLIPRLAGGVRPYVTLPRASECPVVGHRAPHTGIVVWPARVVAQRPSQGSTAI